MSLRRYFHNGTTDQLISRNEHSFTLFSLFSRIISLGRYLSYVLKYRSYVLIGVMYLSYVWKILKNCFKMFKREQVVNTKIVVKWLRN